MTDLVMLAVTAAFFAICVAYVRWCDHIIGPDPELVDDGGAPAPEVSAADGAVDAELVRS